MRLEMVITSIEEYGTRCLLQVAKDADSCPLSAAAIASREGISAEYARKIMHILKNQGLVTATRGKNGGFQLTTPANEITLQMIFTSFRDGYNQFNHLCDKNCAINGGCVNQKECALRPVWSFMSGFFDKFFNSITLQDMMISEKHSAEFIKDLSAKLITL